jgi:hypothetical protein
MRKAHLFLIAGLLGLVAICVLVECAAKPPVPIFVDPNLANMQFDNVTLLPVVDRRVDKSYELNLEGSIGDRVAKRLNKKGYAVDRPGAFSDTIQITPEEIAEMEPYELSTLGGGNSEYLFISYLDDASSKTALGYTFKMEATGILINRQNGAMLWKDKGIGSQGQGGMLGCMMSGVVKGEAMDACIDRMMATFPESPDKRK